MFIVIPHVTKEVSTWSWRFYYFYYGSNTSILAKHKAWNVFCVCTCLASGMATKWRKLFIIPCLIYLTILMPGRSVVSIITFEIQKRLSNILILLFVAFPFTYKPKIYILTRKSYQYINSIKQWLMQSLQHWIEHNLTNLQLLTFISYYI